MFYHAIQARTNGSDNTTTPNPDLPLVLTTALSSLFPIFKKLSKTSFRSLFKNRDLSLTLLESELLPLVMN